MRSTFCWLCRKKIWVLLRNHPFSTMTIADPICLGSLSSSMPRSFYSLQEFHHFGLFTDEVAVIEPTEPVAGIPSKCECWILVTVFPLNSSPIGNGGTFWLLSFRLHLDAEHENFLVLRAAKDEDGCCPHRCYFMIDRKTSQNQLIKEILCFECTVCDMGMLGWSTLLEVSQNR